MPDDTISDVVLRLMRADERCSRLEGGTKTQPQTHQPELKLMLLRMVSAIENRLDKLEGTE